MVQTTGCVEVTVDVKFNESNGSQVEQVDKNLVDMEEPPSVSIMRMGLGEVRPRESSTQAPIEQSNKNQPSSSTRVEPSSSHVPQDQSQTLGDDQDQGNDQGGAQVEATQGDASRVDNDDDGGPIQSQSQVPHPRVYQSIQRDHPVDNILGSIRRGVTTRYRLASFCEHYSFVSSLEPLKVDEALDDPD